MQQVTDIVVGKHGRPPVISLELGNSSSCTESLSVFSQFEDLIRGWNPWVDKRGGLLRMRTDDSTGRRIRRKQDLRIQTGRAIAIRIIRFHESFTVIEYTFTCVYYSAGRFDCA
jgi:hypothetical protein